MDICSIFMLRRKTSAKSSEKNDCLKGSGRVNSDPVTMNNKKRLIIAGAGIGGLTLAIALQRKGIDVTIVEQTPAIRPLGAGLVLAANAVKAFTEIGIEQEVLRAGKALKKLVIKDRRGRVLTSTDSEQISKRYGSVDNFTIHRADLHDVLLKQLQPGSILLGKQCVDFKQNPEGVSLNFQDGTVIDADYVIACDGIHSIFRRKLLPQSEVRYAGYTCWRAVIDKPMPGINMGETSETWGMGSRFGIVPLVNGKIYWFACLNAEANSAPMRKYTAEDLLSHFGDFHEPVPSLIKNTRSEQLIWGDIIDLKPLKKFAFDNIVLMGDAAHATTPNMGQGACMAIEDAVVLANLLDTHSSIQDAFRKFERMRLARTQKVVKGSWQLGRIAQLENPILAHLRNAAIRATPSSVAEKQIKFLYEVSFH
jgi:2-polyprenyl-6-methoxyphenol hydroxylase-like FAD-dependent oxidoreductase